LRSGTGGRGSNGRARANAWSLAAALGLSLALAAPAQSEPQRIVSLDLCTDQLVLELAPRERIAAVTHLAGDAAVSAIPDQAKGIPITHGAAEDVLRHNPDLILAGPFGVSATIDLLRRFKLNVVVVPLAQDLDGVRGSVKTVAQAIGETARGEAMLAEFDRRLGLLATPALARDRPAPSAVLYQVGGVVSGPNSLADAVLSAAGYRNKARDYALARNGQVPLELLVADPPDLLVLASRAEHYPTVAADNLRHPALLRLLKARASLTLPWQLWLCGTPHVAEAVERLAGALSGREKPRP
jgi:iron complex transport system substrate-binding protein